LVEEPAVPVVLIDVAVVRVVDVDEAGGPVTTPCCVPM
jgi:hypothetical protein